MTIGINQLANGTALNMDNGIYMVVEYQHVKPGKGSAFCRVKLRNLKTGQMLDRTFRSSEKFEEVPVEEQDFEFLYHTGGSYHFMNHDTFEEVELPEEQVADVKDFLLENLPVRGLVHENTVLKIMLPTFLEAEIIESSPGVKGDSSRSGNKPAKIATGATIQIPLFVNQGDWVKLDTRTGAYVERIQK